MSTALGRQRGDDQIARHHRQRRGLQDLARVTRHGQPELGAHARSAPRRQPAVVQVGVLHGDGQTESRPADRAGSGGIGPPEPVEHLPGLVGLETHPVIAHGDGDGGIVALDVDVDGMSLAVLDGVDQQVAQDPLDPSGVDLGAARLSGVHAHRVFRWPGRTVRVPRPPGGPRRPRSTSLSESTAAPASNREISSRSVRSASKRSNSFCSSSAERAATGSKSSRASCRTSAAIRTVVNGVRNSCETSETKRCCTADRSSSWLICFCSSDAM